MGKVRLRTWAGGEVCGQNDGSEYFVLKRMRDGRRYDIRLTVKTEKQAMAELALFDRDPIAFAESALRKRNKQKLPARKPNKSASNILTINEASLESFKQYKLQQGMTELWVNNMLGWLSTWMKFYKGHDIREVELSELRAEVARHPTAQQKRIASLKSYTKYLRAEGLLKSKDDPTVDLLMPKQVTPAKMRKALKGETKGHSVELVEKVYAALKSKPDARYSLIAQNPRVTDAQSIRDVVVLACKFGMHVTEIGRIAKGEAQFIPVDSNSGIAGVIHFYHKNKMIHPVSVDAQGVAAIKRLQLRGSVPDGTHMWRTINKTAKTLGVKTQFNIGALRHSWATWARQRGTLVKMNDAGVAQEIIAQIMGHRSGTKTLATYYDETKVPEMIDLHLNLVNEEDPPY